MISTQSNTQNNKTQDKISDIKVTGIISKSRFVIYQAVSKTSKKAYAMKVFPWTNGKISNAYRNENKFHGLNHNNIINIIDCDEKQKVSQDGKVSYASYIMMEYAPYPDFATITKHVDLGADEKLVRTFFRQMIDGVEYMHSQNIAHMDIKAENIVLGEEFQLKLIDFDFAMKLTDPECMGKGTPNYRAPEVKKGQAPCPTGADVYSAGIVLFVLKMGIIPYLENKKIEGHDLFELLDKDSKKFWDVHEQMAPKGTKISKEFKQLFEMMTRIDPKDRATVDEVKKSAWYKAPVYTNKELKSIMSEYFE